MNDNSCVDEVVPSFVQIELDVADFHAKPCSTIENFVGKADLAIKRADSKAHASRCVKSIPLGMACGADGGLVIAKHRVSWMNDVVVLVTGQAIADAEPVKDRLVRTLLK